MISNPDYFGVLFSKNNQNQCSMNVNVKKEKVFAMNSVCVWSRYNKRQLIFPISTFNN